MFRTLFAITIAILSLGASAVTVTIDAKNTRQLIHGFGTTITSWGQLPAIYDDEMARIYIEELGLNILRVNLAGWGYPEEPASAMSPAKIDLRDPDNRRLPIFLSFAKKLKRLNPELKLVGTVWSAPAWMKLNNSVTAKGQPAIQGDNYNAKRVTTNHVDPSRYDQFTRWMIVQAELFRDQGVPFYALSPGNEVMFNQWYESCTWTAEDFARIVGRLGIDLEQHGLGQIKIFGPETMTHHNWKMANPLYVKELQANATAWRYLDAFATHGYIDGIQEDHRAKSSQDFWTIIRNTGKEYWMTEGGTGGHTWPEPLNGVAAAIHNSLVAGNANVFLAWQFTDAKANQHGLMVNRTMTKKTHSFRQFSKFINDGALRLAIPEPTGELQVSAFYHPADGQITVVAINPSKRQQPLTISMAEFDALAFSVHRTSANEDLSPLGEIPVAENMASTAIPAQSIVTLVANLVQRR